MQEETCIILNSLEEKYCGQNKFVAENVEDIWTQLSEGKTIKSILQNSNFYIHKLESLTKEEIEEVYIFVLFKYLKSTKYFFYCSSS